MKVTTSLKLDADIKREAQAVAKSAGLTLSALMNSYLSQVAATRRIELYAPEQMTPKLEALISEVESSIEAGNVSPGFNNAADFLAALKK